MYLNATRSVKHIYITVDTKYRIKWHLQTNDARPLSRAKTLLKIHVKISVLRFSLG